MREFVKPHVVHLTSVPFATSFSGSLSSTSPVVGGKTVVGAGHVTTQNLGGKKILGGRGARVL